MEKFEDVLAFLLFAFSLLGCFAPVLFYACIPVSFAVVIESLFCNTAYEPMIPVTEVLALA